MLLCFFKKIIIILGCTGGHGSSGTVLALQAQALSSSSSTNKTTTKIQLENISYPQML
jgi:hypothetical protein